MDASTDFHKTHEELKISEAGEEHFLPSLNMNRKYIQRLPYLPIKEKCTAQASWRSIFCITSASHPHIPNIGHSSKG